MKIAFHNTGGFTPRWIEYCKKNNIHYKVVNAYDSNIIGQVKDCDAFMWHHHQANYKDVLFAKQLLFSLEKTGKVVFPNTASGTLFDDKVGEKYLLEAIGAPVVPSYVFYTKQEALDWISKTKFPRTNTDTTTGSGLRPELFSAYGTARKPVGQRRQEE